MSLLQRLLADERGTTAVLTALSLAAILGFLALGMESARGLHSKRLLQAAVDQGAKAGVLALRAGAPADPGAEAKALAGLTLAGGDVALRSAWPPASGPFKADRSAVELEAARTRAPGMAGFLGDTGGEIRARAVARLVPVARGCLLAAGQTGALAVRPADLILSGCSALSPLEGVPALRLEEADPYRSRVLPAPSGCSASGLRVGGELTVAGGGSAVFCDGLVVEPGGRVTLGPGVHVVDGGMLIVHAGGLLDTREATIILRGTGGRLPAAASFRPGSVVSLLAPATGPTAGLALVAAAPVASAHSLTTRTLTVHGAIRFPGAMLRFEGNSSGGCAQLIASSITIVGETRLSGTCAVAGMEPLLDRVAMLVE
jgi:hypothetical protein